MMDQRVLLLLLCFCIFGAMGLHLSHSRSRRGIDQGMQNPPPVECPDFLCFGKGNGTFQYQFFGIINPFYFLQCSLGKASCPACSPGHFVFRPECNQCLSNFQEPCIVTTTSPVPPTISSECPDLCPKRGHNFTGNIIDPNNRRQYVACWLGETRGCIACPGNLLFNEKYNACLYDGLYFTLPPPQ